jgi:acrylyl-CoA reductase (NADPH)
MTFKALLATKTDKTISTSVVDVNEHDLMPGDVTIAVDYSTVNYKDALADTGRSEVIRQFPLIAGIDLAGTVEASTHPGIAVGDRVIANGWGLSRAWPAISTSASSPAPRRWSRSIRCPPS